MPQSEQVDFLDQLRSFESEAIGGEMEGSGDRVEFKSISLSLAIEQFYEEIVFEQQSEIS